MSKPESARKAEQTAGEVTNADWGAAASRSRGSETKIAMLLVVVLLGALSFVVYRKLNSQTPALAQSTDFQSVDDDAASPSLAGGTESGDEAWSSSDDAGSPGTDVAQDPWSVAGDLPQNEPPQQPEPTFVDWGSDEPAEPVAESRSTPSFAQSEPDPAAADGSSDVWEPFPAEAGAESTDSRAGQAVATTTGDAVAFDPFTGEALPPQTNASEPIDDGEWESNPDPAADPFAASSTAAVAAAPSSGGTESTAESGPVMELFDGGPEVAQSEPEPTRTAAAADPWGDVADGNLSSEQTEPVARTAAAEPLLIEPRDPQVVPVAAIDPFGAELVEEEPTEAAESFGETDSWDLAAEPESATTTTTAEIDFATEAPTLTFEPDTPASEPVEDVWGAEPSVAGSSESEVPQPDFSPLDTDPFDPAAAVSHAASEEAVTIHVVDSGDSFWSIAKEHYGAGRYFNALAAFNQARIPNPQVMRPGMKVMVPDAAVLQQRYPQLTGGTYSPGQTSDRTGFYVEGGQPMYRVAKGDTLSGIAHKHLGRASRWIQVYGMNQSQLTSASSLKIGMVLRLPNDASRVSAVPESSASR